MWKYISDRHRQRRYRRQQRRIQRCELYVVDDFGLALPVRSTAVIFPEEPVLKNLSTSMLQAEAIGASVVEALDYAGREKDHSILDDYSSIQVGFLDGMERFRKDIGVGKRRFEDQMQLIAITRKDEEIHFKKCYRAHGKFAFEGTMLANGRLVIACTANKSQIGQSVQTLLGKAV